MSSASDDVLDALTKIAISGIDEKSVADRRKKNLDPLKLYDLQRKLAADEQSANGPFVKFRFSGGMD